MHSADCAITLYAHLDPATLKQPLVCDCDASGDDDGDAMPGEDEPLVEPRSVTRPLRPGGEVVLTGEVARAYKLLQGAETALQAAQKRKDEALRAFLEAAIR